MSTITAILEPDADGTLHLPLPAELRRGKVKVVASMEAADAGEGGPRGQLVMGEFARRVLVAPEGAPPMTSERIKAILEEETSGLAR